MIGLQATLPEMTAHLAQSHVAVGLAGEIVIARAFEANGYSVDIAHDRGDLHVFDSDGVMSIVEVKASRKGADGRWQFCLWKKGSQDHRSADFVVLLSVGKSGFGVPFVVPIHVLRDKSKVCLPQWANTYRGYLAPYRQSLRKLYLPDVNNAN
jgi:hypothetical protein